MDLQKSFDPGQLIESLPRKPGIYRMLDDQGTTLYVGKARNLKARVTSYFRTSGLTTKTMSLVARTRDLQVTVTNSETEALLLEQSFIKKERPFYNVLLKDDKSYPYIEMNDDHPFPSIRLHRGSKRSSSRYFGPFPSTASVRDSIAILQKLFRIRSCQDNFFKNRSRPCLQYQIHRCSGPCVNLIDSGRYANELQLAVLFLEGKSQDVLNDLKKQMDSASEDLNFEHAARLRDCIGHLRKVQESQYVHGGSGNIDVFGIAQDSQYVCLHGLFIRDGRVLGHRNWFLKNELLNEASKTMSEFISQYYFGSIKREVPETILSSVAMDDAAILRDALSEVAGRKVELRSRGRTHRARWIALVVENAKLSLVTRMSERRNVFARLVDLQEALGFSEVPDRLECFDVSHSSGEAPVASCVVFDRSGPLRSDYRRFNIGGVEPGDDYAAMRQALFRHYRRVAGGEFNLPDVLVIDGGLGQVRQAVEVLTELELTDICVLGIAKGLMRKPGLETVVNHRGQEVILDKDGGAMHLLQHIRDEAHRFAVAGHRSRRQKKRRQSELDSISGVGSMRKRELLTHFGSLDTIKGASIEELTKVPQIHRKLAVEIYGTFHAS